MTRELNAMLRATSRCRCADAMRSALLRHEARVQRLEERVDARAHDDAKAQVLSAVIVPPHPLHACLR